jgi:sugar-specific transcriptional regulator TrmB
MLTGLIDKGMVNPSLETPTVYAAVELDIALDAALEKYQNELREMEQRKRELQELSKQQRFRPSEFSTFKIIKNVREFLAFITPLVNSLEKELLMVVNEAAIIGASLYGLFEPSKILIDRGRKIRCITNISYSIVELVQQLSDVGEEVRHYGGRGILFAVFDRKSSVNAINVDIERISLDEPITAIWTDDPKYAEYLISTFEMLWERSVPAAQRIEELLKQSPQDV